MRSPKEAENNGEFEHPQLHGNLLVTQSAGRTVWSGKRLQNIAQEWTLNLKQDVACGGK